MDHNRAGLALMVAALLLSVLVVTARGCDDRTAANYARMDKQDQELIAHARDITKPISAYKIRSISSEEGVMTVDAGPSLSDNDLKTVASRLVEAYRDADSASLGSEMFFVRIERNGRRVCHAQTYAGGIYVKLDE